MSNECSQCGLIHPPLKEGETCPMAPEITIDGEVVNYDHFLRSLKDILTSQIKSKKIKDRQKLFGIIIVEITKFLEEYREE